MRWPGTAKHILRRTVPRDGRKENHYKPGGGGICVMFVSHAHTPTPHPQEARERAYRIVSCHARGGARRWRRCRSRRRRWWRGLLGRRRRWRPSRSTRSTTRLLRLGSLGRCIVLLIIVDISRIPSVGSIRIVGARLLAWLLGGRAVHGRILRVVVATGRCAGGGRRGDCGGLGSRVGRVVRVAVAVALAVRSVSTAVVVPIATAVAISAAISIPSTITVAAVVPIPAIASAKVAVSAAIAAVAGAWRTGLEILILLRDVDHEILAQLLGLLDHVGVRAGDVQVHGLLSLTAGRVLDIAGSLALDLHAAAGLLLDVLHVGATVAYDLGAQVEAGNGLEGDGDFLLRPFALYTCQ